jgi:hypothetical protein
MSERAYAPHLQHKLCVEYKHGAQMKVPSAQRFDERAHDRYVCVQFNLACESSGW